MMEEIKVKVVKFLGRFLKNEIQDDTNIFEAGFVNSLFSMQLVMFIEKEFGIKVENKDLNIENFKSIHAITGFVNRKISG